MKRIGLVQLNNWPGNGELLRKLNSRQHRLNHFSKVCWSLLLLFLNNIKITVIPPLFHGNNFEINFKEKVKLFNCSLAKQGVLFNGKVSKLPPGLCFFNGKGLLNVKLSSTDTIKVIRNLDPNKVPSYDKISIFLPKFNGNLICRLSKLIFKDCLANGLFLSDRKKGDILLAQRKYLPNNVWITTSLFFYYR